MIPRSERLTTRAVQTRDLTAATLSLRAETLDVEGRSVEAVLSTENPVTVFDFSRFDLIDERLLADGAEFPSQVPLLDNHARYSNDDVLGSVRDIKRSGKTIVGRLYFAEGDERAEKVWNKVRQGHLTDVSIGYRSLEYTDIKPGQSGVVNGRTYKAGPRGLRVTTKYLIREGSVTPIGADAAAKMRSEAGYAPSRDQHDEGRPMNKALRKYLESLGLRADASNEQAEAFRSALGGDQLRRAEAIEAGTETFPPEQAPADGQRSADPPAGNAPPPQRQADPPADPARVERDRQRSIRELGGNDVDPALVTRALDEGWDVARASQEFLRSMRASRPAPVDGAPFGHVRQTQGEDAVRALSGGLLIRAGADRHELPNMTEAQRRERDETLNRGERFRGLSLPELARECLRAEGRSIPHDREEMVRAAASTQAFASTIERTVNAIVLASFAEAPDSTGGWVAERDVPNFKLNDRWSMGKGGGLKKLGRGNEAEHSTGGDDKVSYRISRYAAQFVMDEQDIIDDDLGLLQQRPQELGVDARRLRPDLIYSLLLANAAVGDGTALFHTNHNNLGTTGTALSIDALADGITKMRKQQVTAKDGKTKVNLNLSPRFLIVPPDLFFKAKTILGSAQVVATGSTDSVRGSLNVLAGEIPELRADNRIGVAGVTDPSSGTAYAGTATNWFLAAGPIEGRTIEVGYLAGSGRMPSVRRFVLDRGKWGVGMDIKLDIGATVLDYPGLYKATGAA